MPTYIFTKERFMKFIAGLEDDELVVFSSDMDGTLSYSKKKGVKLPCVVPPDTFKDEGVGHIMKGQTRVFCILTTKEENLSEDSKLVISR